MKISIDTSRIAEIILPRLETITWEAWQHMDEGTENPSEKALCAEVTAFANMAAMMLSDVPFDGERDGERRVRIVWDADNDLPVGVHVLGKLYKYDFYALRRKYCNSHPGAQYWEPTIPEQPQTLDDLPLADFFKFPDDEDE